MKLSDFLSPKDISWAKPALFRTSEGEIIPANKVAVVRWLNAAEAKKRHLTKGVHIHTVDGRLLPIISMDKAELGPIQKKEIIELEKTLPGKWVLAGTKILANVAHVLSVSGDTRFYLHMRGTDEPMRVSKVKSYIKAVAKALDMRELTHITPDSPYSKMLREHKLLDLGYQDFLTLDVTDEKAVLAFLDKWDIRCISYEDLEKYFGYGGTKGVDSTIAVRNFLWQQYHFMKWGIIEQYSGDVRSLWYPAQSVIGHHEDVEDYLSTSSYDSALKYIILENEFFTYRDMGYFDVRKKLRIITEKHPDLILMSEKEGHYYRLEEMAEPYEVSFACTKGQPPNIMMKYLCDELREAGVDVENDTIILFIVSDYDASGQSIEENMKAKLIAETDVRYVKTYDLVDLRDFDDRAVRIAKTRSVQYTLKHGKPIPYPEDSDKTHFTKTYTWWQSIPDDQKERVHSEKERNGKVYHTIWKVNSDSLPWKVIRNKFKQMITEVLPNHRKWHDTLKKLNTANDYEANQVLDELETNLDEALKVCAKELIVDKVVQSYQRRRGSTRDRAEGLLNRFAAEEVFAGWRRVGKRELLDINGPNEGEHDEDILEGVLDHLERRAPSFANKLAEQVDDIQALTDPPKTEVLIDDSLDYESMDEPTNFDTRWLYILTIQKPELMTMELAKEHVEHLKGLENRGKLELCGPFKDGKGGMVILRGVSKEEARAIAESDPFVSSGAESYELRQLEVSSRDNGHLGLG